MKRFVFVVFAVTCGCSSSEQIATPETIRVSTLFSEDLILPVNEIYAIRPLGWAMTLDIQRGSPGYKRTLELYRHACAVKPDLSKEVDRLLKKHAEFKALKTSVRTQRRICL